MYIYLETEPNSCLFNFRGQVSKNDDPAGFARMMALSGLRTALSTEFLGLQARLDEVEVCLISPPLPEMFTAEVYDFEFEEPEFEPEPEARPLWRRIVGL